MNYKQTIQKQIQELEEKIQTYSGEKIELVKLLNNLRFIESQENNNVSDNRQLLKG
jgi:hypothetical protein